MIRQNLHTHTTFSDGKNTPEEMLLWAIQKGFMAIGFSDHAYAPYDLDCCIPKAKLADYFAEVGRLKREYAAQIDVFAGLEFDCYHLENAYPLDYSIGSAHYAFCGATGKYYTIDYLPQMFEQAVQEVAGGDVKALVASYFDAVSQMALHFKPDILGHIDLITKLNTDNCYFDTCAPWYRDLIAKTAREIAKSGCIVEVNTGGMYRNNLSAPYPAAEFLAILCDRRVPVIISSDAHNAQSLDFWFADAVNLLKSVGYSSVKQLGKDGFYDEYL